MLNLEGKISLKIADKYIEISNLSMYYTCKVIKMSHKNNKLLGVTLISGPT